MPPASSTNAAKAPVGQSCSAPECCSEHQVRWSRTCHTGQGATRQGRAGLVGTSDHRGCDISEGLVPLVSLGGDLNALLWHCGLECAECLVRVTHRAFVVAAPGCPPVPSTWEEEGHGPVLHCPKRGSLFPFTGVETEVHRSDRTCSRSHGQVSTDSGNHKLPLQPWPVRRVGVRAAGANGCACVIWAPLYLSSLL